MAEFVILVKIRYPDEPALPAAVEQKAAYCLVSDALDQALEIISRYKDRTPESIHISTGDGTLAAELI